VLLALPAGRGSEWISYTGDEGEGRVELFGCRKPRNRSNDSLYLERIEALVAAGAEVVTARIGESLVADVLYNTTPRCVKRILVVRRRKRVRHF